MSPALQETEQSAFFPREQHFLCLSLQNRLGAHLGGVRDRGAREVREEARHEGGQGLRRELRVVEHAEALHDCAHLQRRSGYVE